MIEEYHYKPMLSPPFSLFFYIIHAWKLIDKCRKNSVAASETDPNKILTDDSNFYGLI